MRVAVLALMAIGTVSAIDVTPAQAWDYPFCLRTRFDTDDCRYESYQQCQWAASGTGQDCFANPALAYAPQYVEEPAPRRRHRHRRVY